MRQHAYAISPEGLFNEDLRTWANAVTLVRTIGGLILFSISIRVCGFTGCRRLGIDPARKGEQVMLSPMGKPDTIRTGRTRCHSS
jgi:hypothetical protein